MARSPLDADDTHAFLGGDGEMATLTRAFDWSTTSLGPVASWPQSTRTSVSTMLRSPYPITMFWGSELVMLYNDAFRPIHGAKHPAVLGMPAAVGLAEAWGQLGPLVRGVLASEQSLFIENAAVVFERGAAGEKEEAYFTWCYIPTADESGGVAGLFAISSETTAQVVGGRRLAVLRELSIRTALDQDVGSVFRSVEDVLTQAAADVPFAMLYVVEGDAARLVSCTGALRESAAAPLRLALDGGPWPLAEVVRTQRETVIENLDATVGALPGGPWPQPSTRALVLPVAMGAGLEGVLVAGLCPLRPLDEDYRSFLQLLGRQIAASASSARAYDQERQRAQQLAELDRAKTAFFSNVSHEFRTPLTLILGPVEDALAQPSRSLAGDRLELVRRNTLRLAKMVNTLLDFSRMEAGRAEASYVPTDLVALTEGLASAFRAVVESAGMRFVVACAPLPEPVWVDPEMWEKIVLNLISNAVKYTHRGEIRVGLAWQGEGAVLTVSDTGVGIPEAELPRVFERFYRVRSTEGRSHEGTGIGLALVQELVKLHGGDVAVESEVGRGTTLTVRLSRGTSHLDASRVVAAPSTQTAGAGSAAFVEEARRWSTDLAAREELPDDARATVDAWHVPSALAASRILFVDDNADLRAYVVSLLGRSFPHVETARDGQDALARIAASLPDLVLSDVMMPGLDGFGLVRALRGDPRTRAVPIILLSARAGDESTVEGLASGADDYLVKPFSARELLARVCTQLEMARVRRESARRELAEEELRAAVRTRDEWLNLVGHELRTPVSALSLGVQSLVRGVASEPEATETLRTRAHSAERLLHRLEHRVEELVSISELVTGRWEPTLEAHDLAALTASLVQQKQADAERAGSTLHVVRAEEGVSRVDAPRIAQALAQLVDNALKFGAGRPVELAVDVAAAEVTITVTDHGPGVPTDAKERMFDRFSRSTSADHYGGLGLGLWVARHVAVAHGGTLASSETAGGGATFSLVVPRAA